MEPVTSFEMEVESNESGLGTAPDEVDSIRAQNHDRYRGGHWKRTHG